MLTNLPPAPADDEVAADDVAVPPAVTDFAEVTAEEWEAFMRDPDSRAGDGIVFYAEVFQFDTNTNTGTDSFLANAGPQQPAGEFALQDSVIITLFCSAGSGIAEGDVLPVEGSVGGVQEYETLIGGDNSVPLVAAVTLRTSTTRT